MPLPCDSLDLRLLGSGDRAARWDRRCARCKAFRRLHHHDCDLRRDCHPLPRRLSLPRGCPPGVVTATTTSNLTSLRATRMRIPSPAEAAGWGTGLPAIGKLEDRPPACLRFALVSRRAGTDDAAARRIVF